MMGFASLYPSYGKHTFAISRRCSPEACFDFTLAGKTGCVPAPAVSRPIAEKEPHTSIQVSGNTPDFSAQKRNGLLRAFVSAKSPECGTGGSDQPPAYPLTSSVRSLQTLTLVPRGLTARLRWTLPAVMSRTGPRRPHFAELAEISRASGTWQDHSAGLSDTELITLPLLTIVANGGNRHIKGGPTQLSPHAFMIPLYISPTYTMKFVSGATHFAAFSTCTERFAFTDLPDVGQSISFTESPSLQHHGSTFYRQPRRVIKNCSCFVPVDQAGCFSSFCGVFDGPRSAWLRSTHSS